MRRSLAALPLLLLAIAAHGERDPTDVIAVVLGQEITVADVAESSIDLLMNGLLVRKFAEDNGIEPTEEEIAAFVGRMAESQRQSLSDFEADRAELAEALDGAVDPEERRGMQDHLDALERGIENMSQSQQAGPEVWHPIAKRWVERRPIQKSRVVSSGIETAGIERIGSTRRGVLTTLRHGADGPMMCGEC